jgi:large subunit ribosomal protein L29
MIEFAQIRKMSDRELDDALKQAKQDLWAARFALSTRQLANTSTIPQHRKSIARILTVQRERQEGGSTTSAAATVAAPATAAPAPAGSSVKSRGVKSRAATTRSSGARSSGARATGGRATTSRAAAARSASAATAEPAKRTK